MGTICLPSANDNATFEVTNTTLHLLQMKGLYGGLAHEDPYKHMTNFIDVQPFFIQECATRFNLAQIISSDGGG